MPKTCYEEKNFRPASLVLINQANAIIEAYRQQGYSLTLRQLYYQFVARDLIENTQRSYKRLGGVINDARLAGLIDWTAIEDRTRNLKSLGHWDDPSDIIGSAAASYRLDRWVGQPNRVEIWVEKEALAGVVERGANKWDVPFFCCRGYTSQSEMWSAAQRLARYVRNGWTPYIIHLGDHDPSGIDMTRDVDDRIEKFLQSDLGGHAGGFTVNRIALNIDQIEEFNPPPNPTKLTDSRAGGYCAEFGGESWELDALEPSVLNRLIDEAIDPLVDHDRFAQRKEQQEEGREVLEKVATNWPKVRDFAEENL